MKISRIEFENFRNFRDSGKIDFPTDGSVTIIYGPNGVGKTTLHQLFQWIIYGEVHFNKTASNKMYNLEYEKDISWHQVFSVVGSIDFEHPNSNGVIEKYKLRREWKYRKEHDESKIINQDISLTKEINGDWKPVSNAEKMIEQILPTGLSQYFFFDGESMIADLNQKGKDSAKSLRKALYSIFDLDLYEQAIVHLGTQDSGKYTVLGSLYQSLAEASSDRDVIVATGEYNFVAHKVEKLEKDINDYTSSIERYKKEIQELSEKIGNTPSKEVLEKQRSKAKSTIKTFEDAISREKKAFGETIMSKYPHLFLSRMVAEAQLRIGLKIEDQKLPKGLTKELVLLLLESNQCICGTPINEKEREALQKLEKMFPPHSYKHIYDQFKSSAIRWGATYDKGALLKHIEAIFQYRDKISELREEIHNIDEQLKQGGKVDEYIAKRKKAEDSQQFWTVKLKDANREIGLQEQLKKQRKRKLDKLLEANTANVLVHRQLEVMEAVKDYYVNKLHDSAIHYSESLRLSIQELLEKMLTSTRHVYMTPQFELSVKDSFGDEAKSEGQFAVVSFAYIGGVLKLLSDSQELTGKEFPLVLDGPFSKLDVIQRQNVINTIPTYAPQVILFSKDDINACFDTEITDNVWTIYSNEERNVSYVKKGYNPEVFRLNGTEN